MPRPKKCRRVCRLPQTDLFFPRDYQNNQEPIVISIDEFETIRLIDYENLSQEECGKVMQIARTTVQLIYGHARTKISKALVEARPLKIEGGDYTLCHENDEKCHCRKCYKKSHQYCMKSHCLKIENKNLKG